MSRLNYYSNGWQNLPDGTRFKYWNGSAWTNPNKVAVWDGSSWLTVWNKSDPVTYTYYPWFCDNLRHGTSNAWTTSSSNEPHIGGYNGSYPYPYVGVLSIGNSTDGVSSHNADQVIATRPVIKSITLRLTRASGVGLNASVVSGTMNIGTMSYPVASWGTGTMATVDNYFDFSPNSTQSLSGWDYNATKTISLDPQHGYDMINSQRALIIASQTSGFTSTDSFSGYSSSLDYMKFYDHNNGTAAYRPMWTITFDYV